VIIIAKMALENGSLDGKEGVFLDRMCARMRLERAKVEDAAREHRLAEVLEVVVTEPDRHVVAFHAYMMAKIDGEVDDWERGLYDIILSLLEISLDDQRAIEGWADQVIQGGGMPPGFSSVVAASSFKGM
jgi:hypothetical protein